MKLRFLSIITALLFLASCGEKTNGSNLTKEDCTAGTSDHIADYINDLKGDKLFVKKGDEYVIAKDSIRYGDDVFLQKGNFGSQKDYYNLYLAPNMMPKGQNIDWTHKNLSYLLLETKPCILLLEVYQVHKAFENSSIKVEKTIEFVIWQKQGEQWKPVTKDFLPFEELKERLTSQHPTIVINDKENTIQLQLVEPEITGNLNVKTWSASINKSHPTLYFEKGNIHTLAWKDGRFDFILAKENAEELAMMLTGSPKNIHLDYSGVLNGTNLVTLSMDLEPKELKNIAITGNLEIRGKESYPVQGFLYTKNGDRKMDLRLVKNGQIIEVLTGKISAQHPSDIIFKGKENATLVPNSLILTNQKIKDLVLHPQSNSLVDYSNEIFTLLKIPNGGNFYGESNRIGNSWESLNKAFFEQVDNAYQLNKEYSFLKTIKSINKNHLVFNISDFEDLYNEGSDLLEMSKYGTLQHILLDDNSKQPKVLEIGQFIDTIDISYPDTEREDENGEIIRDSDLEGIYFVSYIRVLERTPEGFWINVNEQVMPNADKLLKAVQFFYPQLTDIDYFYNYDENIDEEYLPQKVELILNYQAKIAGFQGEKTERSFDPAVFKVEWKDNVLYIAGEKGIKLEWDGTQFKMETNAVMNIKTENCFNVDQLKFNKEQKVNYVGNINNEYDIEMDITFGRDNDGGFLNGTYWYTNNNNKPIEVSGDYNPFTKEVTILHYKEGKISETFLGKYGNDCRITGTWKKGEKELPFSIGEKAKSEPIIEEDE